MNNILKLSSVVLASTLILMGCEKAEAANVKNNVSVTLGYQDDRSTEIKGAFVEGSVTKNNLRIGVNTSLDEKSRMINYGTFIGVPLQLNNSSVVLTPNVGVTHYRDSNVNNAVVRLDTDYLITPTFSIGGKVAYSKTINNDNTNLKGASYTLALTKLF